MEAEEEGGRQRRGGGGRDGREAGGEEEEEEEEGKFIQNRTRAGARFLTRRSSAVLINVL